MNALKIQDVDAKFIGQNIDIRKLKSKDKDLSGSVATLKRRIIKMINKMKENPKVDNMMRDITSKV